MINKLKRIWWSGKLMLARVYYGDPARKLKTVGVTGTNGKTTTATLLYKIATALGYKAGLVSTVEILIAGEKINTKENTPGTTPDSVFLVKLFSRMAAAGCEYVFMEVSSHALDQNRVAGINFSGGIFTNLTHDHLDYHGNLENYFQAKKKFFDKLPTSAFALSNADDTHGRVILQHSRAKKFFYGFEDKEVNFKGSIDKLDFSGLELNFNNETIKPKLLGKFNAYNLLAVWSACKLLGFDMEGFTSPSPGGVNKILESIAPPRGRFEHLKAPNGALVIVDYAHSPDALEKVLIAAREVLPVRGKLIALAGCGGDRDPLKRPKMGKIVASLADIPILTSDNPRSEDPGQIIAEMLTDLSPEDSSKVKTITNRREAIAEAMRLAGSGDIILCAGKGHEDYQEIKGVRHHFDDREEFEKIFKSNLATLGHQG